MARTFPRSATGAGPRTRPRGSLLGTGGGRGPYAPAPGAPGVPGGFLGGERGARLTAGGGNIVGGNPVWRLDQDEVACQRFHQPPGQASHQRGEALPVGERPQNNGIRGSLGRKPGKRDLRVPLQNVHVLAGYVV